MASAAEHPQSRYTQAERDLIAKCLKDGESGGQIAVRLGRSRNSVIGVVHRDKRLKEIGFARAVGDRSGIFTGVKPRRRYVRKQTLPLSFPAHRTVKPRPLPESMWCEPQLAGRPMSDLRPNQCRFAVNDAGRGGLHLFCGLPSDGAWCDFHRGLVYQPNSSLRSKAA